MRMRERYNYSNIVYKLCVIWTLAFIAFGEEYYSNSPVASIAIPNANEPFIYETSNDDDSGVIGNKGEDKTGTETY